MLHEKDSESGRTDPMGDPPRRFSLGGAPPNGTSNRVSEEAVHVEEARGGVTVCATKPCPSAREREERWAGIRPSAGAGAPGGGAHRSRCPRNTGAIRGSGGRARRIRGRWTRRRRVREHVTHERPAYPQQDPCAKGNEALKQGRTPAAIRGSGIRPPRFALHRVRAPETFSSVSNAVHVRYL